MIYGQAGGTITAVLSADETGLVGTGTQAVERPDGTELLAPITTGIVEIEPQIYVATRELPTDAPTGDYIFVWANEGPGPDVHYGEALYIGPSAPSQTASVVAPRDPFISRDDLADHLHLPDGALDEDEAALQAVDAACEWLRDLTGQLFNYVADETILMDGTGTDVLLLPQLPVVEVSSVAVAGYADMDGYASTLHDSGVLMRIWEPTGAVVSSQAAWPKGRNNVEITYTHGYADAELPRSVRMLAVRMAARFYQQAPGVIFESLGQRSIRYDTNAGDLSTAEQLVVRKHTYKRQPSYVVVA